MGHRFAPECNHTVQYKCPCISENEVNFIKYIDEPVGLGLTDLWNISLQNRSPRWPQFFFPRPQNKLAKSTHTSKITSTFIFHMVFQRNCARGRTDHLIKCDESRDSTVISRSRFCAILSRSSSDL